MRKKSGLIKRYNKRGGIKRTHSHKYYMCDLMEAFKQPDDTKYFNKMFRDHYMSSIKGLSNIRRFFENTIH